MNNDAPINKIVCSVCGCSGVHACMGPITWPDETAIDLTGINGECDAPIYKYNGLLWRMNPVGRYALYFHKGTWRESQQDTNEKVLAGGILQ